MLLPFIRSCSFPYEPFEIFKSLYRPGRKAFFFDSHGYFPPKQRWSYIGFDPFLEVSERSGRLRVSANGGVKTHPLKDIFPILRRLFDRYRMPDNPAHDFFCGGAVGFWAYELVEYFEKIKLRKKKKSETPLLYLGFYRDLIVYDHLKQRYHLVSLYDAKRPVFSRLQARKRVAEMFEVMLGGTVLSRGHWHRDLAAHSRKSSSLQHELMRTVPSPYFTAKNFRAEMPRRRFEAMVRRAKEYIAAGDIYQANLSQRFSFRHQGNPFGLYETLRKINPSPFASFLDTGKIKIVSSSPERLIRKRKQFCETCPIAGTKPRPGNDREAGLLERQLRKSPKERAEHIMLVDLERNDLGRVCDWPTVKVKKLMSVEKYSHVIHLVSEITGRLSKGKDAFDLIRAMFPGGTITGCPKVRCMEIIDELEPVERGIYTGSLGYVGFNGDMDLNIVIRTLVLNLQKGFLQVGSGIVHDSDPRREYEETLHKAEALVRALKITCRGALYGRPCSE